MRTKPILSDEDICNICDNKCPENIYDCPNLNEAIKTKNASYIWCWVHRDKK